jgi:uncharacterized cupredoxin-like copper-binding protein
MRLGARRRSLLWCGCGLAAFALGAAACGGSSSHTSGGSSTTGAASSGSTSSASSAPAPAPASGGGTQVTVGETEFKLAVSTQSFSPGSYTFKAVNNGRIAHSLEITGPGLSHALTPTLQPGQSADLHVTLQDGSYDLFCPIDSHKSLGMNDEITVGAAGASTATNTPSTTVPSTTVPSSGGVSY